MACSRGNVAQVAFFVGELEGAKDGNVDPVPFDRDGAELGVLDGTAEDTF